MHGTRDGACGANLRREAVSASERERGTVRELPGEQVVRIGLIQVRLRDVLVRGGKSCVERQTLAACVVRAAHGQHR
jgi:hypothetical protein